MEDAGFLFVNEDPGGRRRKGKGTSIHRHAALSVIARKRTKLPPSAAPRGWSNIPPTSGAHEATLRSMTEDGTYDSALNKWQLKPEQNSYEKAIADSSIPSAAILDAQDLHLADKIRSQLEPWKYTVIDYYIRFWAKSPTIIENQRDIFISNAIAERVQSCLTTEVHMYALASAVSAHMRAITKTAALRIKDQIASPEAFLHRAIQGLRAYFPTICPGDKVDPQILVDMMDLFRAEYFARRTNAGKQHVWIFDSLVDRGEIHQPKRLRCKDSWNLCAVIQALCNHSPHLLAEHKTAEKPKADGVHQEISRSAARIGIAFDAVGSLFNSEMRSFIDETVHWARRTSSKACDFWPDEFAAGEDLLYRLVWMPSPQPTMILGEERTHLFLGCKVPCVRFALLLWLLLATSHPSLQEASMVLLPRLRNHLGMVVEEAQNSESRGVSSIQDLFFWVASIGLVACVKLGLDVSGFVAPWAFFRGGQSWAKKDEFGAILERFLPLPEADASFVSAIDKNIGVIDATAADVPRNGPDTIQQEDLLADLEKEAATNKRIFIDSRST